MTGATRYLCIDTNNFSLHHFLTSIPSLGILLIIFDDLDSSISS
jgi:hypothetical protein